MFIKLNIYGQITYSLHFDDPILQNVTYENINYKEVKIKPKNIINRKQNI